MKQDVPVAIIGMGCLFPGSSGLNEYWRLLFRGEDGIREVPPSHWSPEDYFDPDPQKPDHVNCKRGGFLPPVLFDPTEFGIPPNCLEATDTSQLLGLTAACMALEDAGYGKNRSFDRSRVSVVLGATGTQELVIPLGARLGHPKWRKALESAGISKEKSEEIIKRLSDSYVSWQENSFPGLLGNVIAGRICNRLDLGGTNCSVDAACASSMSAVHLAILELISGHSSMVVTGGVDTLNDIFMHMCFARTHILSPSGDVRPFSKDADGTVLGEGIGILVLKRLQEAEKDKDKIYAVIKGIGTSSDGRSQSIYAPHADGQKKALRTVYRNSQIDPVTVELIEAHGTGTRVGDRVEFESLAHVFSEAPENKCALGSVKSMIGHTKAAAGSAGLIKAALGIYHKVLPPTIKVDQPDPGLNIQKSPFYINTKARPWLSSDQHPRRAGVSAFGFGGSNFHVILEEYGSKKSDVSWHGAVEILAFSGKHPDDILKSICEYENLVKKNEKGLLFPQEIALFAQKSRMKFSHQDPYRLLMVVKPNDNRFQQIAKAKEKCSRDNFDNFQQLLEIFSGGPAKDEKIAFLFPGQGSQYVEMGRELVCMFPEALDALQKADESFVQIRNSGRLSKFMYPVANFSSEKDTQHQKDLRKTDIAQPAIGAVSLAMFRIMSRFGITPDAVAGHSFGELTALLAAGVISEKTFLELAVNRGLFMSRSLGSQGAMMAVKAPIKRLEQILQETNDSEVILANRNSPEQGVLSGPCDKIARLETICRKQGFVSCVLPVSAAFHTPAMQTARDEFEKCLLKSEFFNPQMPVFSNSNGELYPENIREIKRALADQLLMPVDFVSQIGSMYDSGVRTFLEVGPGKVLSGLARSTLKNKPVHVFSMDWSSGNNSGVEDLARTLCHLAALGYPADLTQWESTEKKIPKQRMSIPISGANIRVEKNHKIENSPQNTTKERSGFGPENKSSHSAVARQSKSQNQKFKFQNPIFQTQNPKSKNESRMNKNKKDTPIPTSIPTSRMENALNVIQEGLKSMQALQMQTAETHRKFLETQSEASRTLQQMMAHTQRLAEVTMGRTEFLEPPLRSHGAGEPDSMSLSPQTKDSGYTKDDSVPFSQISEAFDLPPKTAQSSVSEPIFEKSKPVSVPAAPEKTDSQQTIKTSPSELESDLLSVVSDLTGYPTEMLDLDMDIESDLGIDSIKRVEILSSLEERVSGLPQVSAEQMGRLKTLGQVLEQLRVETKPSSISSENASSASAKSEKENDSETVSGELSDKLLEIVAELTGYPTEMLGLDMDIESDLGIDSIKRVEILSALEERVSGLPQVSAEQMGRLKTLGEIIDFLLKGTKNKISSLFPDNYNSIGEGKREVNLKTIRNNDNYELERKVISLEKAPPLSGKQLCIPNGRKVRVADTRDKISSAIVKKFASLNIDAELVSLDSLDREMNNSPAGGLIIPAGEKTTEKFLKDAFSLAQKMAGELRSSAEAGGAIFSTITFMDGGFGFRSHGIKDPLQGGLAGLAKTAALEWQGVNCRALDIDPAWTDTGKMAEAIAEQLLDIGSPEIVEIAIGEDFRLTPILVSSGISEARMMLESEDVVMVSGGARGVTAAAVKALAEEIPLNFVLLGRTHEPTEEPGWLAGLTDEKKIKKAIIENEITTSAPTPARVEKRFKGIMAKREIRDTLNRLQELGSSVKYLSVDICDETSTRELIDQVRKNYGPVKAVIHGAGVLEDRLIENKTLEQFERVLATKVTGLKSLLKAVGSDPLKYLILFSSVAARFGNKGQSDYAMANEVINKFAHSEAASRKNCRVISINWGPWDGGMVSPVLKNEFVRRNIALIPMEVGGSALVREMKGEIDGPVEIILGKSLLGEVKQNYSEPPSALKIDKPPNTGVDTSKMSLTFKREIDLERYPILGSHVLGGKPVVPFALMTEWMGYGALHANPGLTLQGLDNIRLLQGIKLDEEMRTIRLLAGKLRKKGAVFEVDVEIRDGFKEGREVLHTKASAILADYLPEPPSFDTSVYMGTSPYSKQIDEIYEKVLFHGIELQGIKKIISLNANSVIAEISTAPAPSQWMSDPLRSRWIADPLVLDSAFQMAIIWSFEIKKMVCLPSYAMSYRQYRSNFPPGGISAIFEIKQAGDNKLTGDFTFLDKEKGSVVARLTGYEAIMDQTLFEAFKPAQIKEECIKKVRYQ